MCVCKSPFKNFTFFSVTLGVLYAYLAEGVGHSKAAEGAFRALSRGYTHWASGHLECLEINVSNPSYCHVRVSMKPLMKQGSYNVYILLERTKEDMASIQTATCQCTAGYVNNNNTIEICIILTECLYMQEVCILHSYICAAACPLSTDSCSVSNSFVKST